MSNANSTAQSPVGGCVALLFLFWLIGSMLNSCVSTTKDQNPSAQLPPEIYDKRVQAQKDWDWGLDQVCRGREGADLEKNYNEYVAKFGPRPPDP